MRGFRGPLIVAMLVVATCSFPVHADSDAPIHPTPNCAADRVNWTMGVVFCDNNTTEGYTLFAPIPSNTTYLIDQEGRFVHSWTSPGEHRPALSAYLLPDGDLLRTANIASTAVGNFSGGGTGGKLERISWDGTLEWAWEYSSETFISHHDIEPMPNGNILMIAWEDRTEQEALQAGRNPAIASDSPGGENNVWPDHIIEIEPVGNDSANIVWKWHAWDHLIQDYDSTKDNYGVVADHPERININYVGGTGNAAGRADWMHCNGIDYNPILDQIAISCRSMHEIYIIDHSTTTEEAAGHTGGTYGKGGDILYRWGNPQVYDHGLSSDQQFFAQHDVQWIETGHPYEGALSVFNNGNGRFPAYSSVDIIVPPLDNGSYILESNGTFGPSVASWTWDIGEGMYSGSISGVDMMSNGHMLVTHGTKGTLYEVSTSGNVVWEYINPIGGSGAFTQGEEVPEGNRAGSTANAIFKAQHISIEHPALTNVDSSTGTYLETWFDQCPSEEAWGWDRDGNGCIDDTDGDGINDPYDICSAGDDSVDVDDDNIPDACDTFVDRDDDGVNDEEDRCAGHDDNVDLDNDSVPDGCDDLVDSDGDGIDDGSDLCIGYDDAVDADDDGTPDGCDALIDNDGDGIANADDVCEGHDDTLDSDDDGIPDGCDEADGPGDNNTLQDRQSSNETDQETPSSAGNESQRIGIVMAGLLFAAVGIGYVVRKKD